MPSIARVGDEVLSIDGEPSSYHCTAPMKTACGNTVGNTKVYAGGILVVVAGDPVAPHNKSDCVPDETTLQTSSSKVRACGIAVGMIGDTYGGVNTITQGSSKVFSA